MNNCRLCPRDCCADRSAGVRGFCGASDKFRIARAALHAWEEPPISGTRGSGAVFFSGCSLRCVYCQNYDVSHRALGRDVGEEELERLIFDLAAQGAHNINLVTPTHYADRLARLLTRIKPRLGIPVVWNCGGYERLETLKMLDGLVDIYLPDFKYADSELAEKYSSAADYPQTAAAAVVEMFRQVGAVGYSESEPGLLSRGVIVRHLVLPGCRRDSSAVLKLLSELLPVDDILLSLMSQYTPEFAAGCSFSNLKRRLTSFEYSSVLETASSLGFNGFAQERGSATAAFTPDFSGNDG